MNGVKFISVTDTLCLINNNSLDNHNHNDKNKNNKDGIFKRMAREDPGLDTMQHHLHCPYNSVYCSSQQRCCHRYVGFVLPRQKCMALMTTTMAMKATTTMSIKIKAAAVT